MRNKRMQQIVAMFSYITGISASEAEGIILRTKTGRDIANNCEIVLYEQQTENLSGIAMELRDLDDCDRISLQLSDERIVEAMKQLKNIEKLGKDDFSFKMRSENDVDARQDAVQKLSEKQKHMLRIQNQNRMNVGRITHADKLKR